MCTKGGRVTTKNISNVLKIDKIVILSENGKDSPAADMLLRPTSLHLVGISSVIAWWWICLNTWCSLLMPGVECKHILFSADESYNDYYNDVFDEEQEQSEYTQKSLLNDGDCGVDGRSAFTKRVLNGSSAHDHIFPWTVKLYRVDERGKLGLCTGSLISDRHVLTAAHCVYGKDYVGGIVVLMGAANPHPRSHQTIKRTIQAIRMHGGYLHEGLVRDIALLALSESVRYGSTLRPACLPDPYMEHYAWETVIVAGHGVAGYKESSKKQKPKFPRVLQYAYLKVQSDYRCSLAWARYGQFNPEYQICAKKGFQGPCGGDSGGPLMHRSRSTYKMYVIGITSYVKGRSSTKCLTKYGGVFVRVSAYYRWIMEGLDEKAEGWVATRCEADYQQTHDSCKLYHKILQLLQMD
ncbi:enteropeptidase-like [Tropilaelaps mercedesae]|uniref:Enteropeptidase-like n=1 Tax=Tropilaelaps mercedesae TaxID=418985 RepID=A0A1V9X120_9ACAR|nr:enteropeptidase-like [Tropilaelaps mercedesae]